MEANYQQFLERKAPRFEPAGFDPKPMPQHMTGHYGEAARLAIARGRCALFLDTGLGKTTIELEWARQVADYTDKPTLILAPLAVAPQIGREAHRFGVDAEVMRDGAWKRPAEVMLANYDRIDAIDFARFGGVALDESSLLKSFSGKVSRSIISRSASVPYRLAATATPAPNDHMELGQHADFLGVMSSPEMLARWFINDTATASKNWRLKGHAETAFWDWMASWAVMAETPEDLGFDGSAFVLPELIVHKHKAAGDHRKPIGGLFAEDISATNMFKVKRDTAGSRADVVAELVRSEPDEAWIIWCDTDDEADQLMARLPSGAVEIRGSHSPDRKEQAALGFCDGSIRHLVSKASIFGAGLNFQHCARQAFVGRSFSYELWYQAVRRCWRFGQQRPVHVHLIVAEGEAQIGRVIDRKAVGHATMKHAMRSAQRRALGRDAASRVPYNPTHRMEWPRWLLA